jgi:hypothetical protein
MTTGQPKREDSQKERTAKKRGQPKREDSQKERTAKKRGQPNQVDSQTKKGPKMGPWKGHTLTGQPFSDIYISANHGQSYLSLIGRSMNFTYSTTMKYSINSSPSNREFDCIHDIYINLYQYTQTKLASIP